MVLAQGKDKDGSRSAGTWHRRTALASSSLYAASVMAELSGAIRGGSIMGIATTVSSSFGGSW